MRVVLADDHSIVREGLRWMLEEEPGIEISGEADSGTSLLQLLGEEPADVVLLDLRMPGMGGLEALERLRQVAPGTKVIILTMHDEPAYVRRAIELGASGYLLKSADRQELVRALELVHSGGAYVQGELAAPLVQEAAGVEQEATSLSPRESQVLFLVAQGFENKQIATELGISEATVKTHLKSVFARLEVASRAEAVAVALRRGLIE